MRPGAEAAEAAASAGAPGGAHRPREAVALGRRYADSGVSWYEEPVSSDDVDGLAQVRRQLSGAMDVTAGEYGSLVPPRGVVGHGLGLDPEAVEAHLLWSDTT